MRIGIIGAQGVGKTVLIDALLEEPEFKNYIHAPSPTRFLMQTFGMSFDNANTEIQLATLCMQVFNMLSYPNAFLDRTVIDNFAYLRYHAAKGNTDLSINALNFIEYVTQDFAHRLDYIFLIPVEFGIEEDGVRNTDPEQQKEIEKIIIGLLSEFSIEKKKLFYLTGTVEQRVLAVKRVIGEQGGTV